MNTLSEQTQKMLDSALIKATLYHQHINLVFEDEDVLLKCNTFLRTRLESAKIIEIFKPVSLTKDNIQFYIGSISFYSQKGYNIDFYDPFPIHGSMGETLFDHKIVEKELSKIRDEINENNKKLNHCINIMSQMKFY